MTITELKELLTQFNDSDIRELQFSDSNSSLYLNKNKGAKQQPLKAETPIILADKPAQLEESISHKHKEETHEAAISVDIPNTKGEVITSPLVGMVYTSPAPEESPFVSVGQHVTKGETLCIVEAMKIMNEIPSPITGRVTAVLIKNDIMVEYGQPLFEISQEVN